MTKIFRQQRLPIELPTELDDFKQVLIQAANSGKYASNNWLNSDGGKQDKKSQYDSISHHINAYLRGDVFDKDSRLDHRLHAACRLMMDYTRDKRGIKHPLDKPSYNTYLTEIEKLNSELKRLYQKNEQIAIDNTSGNECRNVRYTSTKDLFDGESQ